MNKRAINSGSKSAIWVIGFLALSFILLLISCNSNPESDKNPSSKLRSSADDFVARQNADLGLKLSRQNKTIYLPPGHPLLDREKGITDMLNAARKLNFTASVPFSPRLPASFAELSEQEKEIVLNLDPTVGRVGVPLSDSFLNLASDCQETTTETMAEKLRGVSYGVEKITDPEAFLTNPLTGQPYQVTNPEKIPGNIYLKLLSREEFEEFLQANPGLNLVDRPPKPQSWLFVRIWGPDRVILETILARGYAGPCSTYPSQSGE